MNDGGNFHPYSVTGEVSGIRVRDYFALSFARVLFQDMLRHTELADAEPLDHAARRVAETAYTYADAMLKARNVE